MTTPPSPAHSVQHHDLARYPLYDPSFAADPHGTYHDMRRRHHSLVPILLAPDVPATLVISYKTAVRILNDPTHFPSDPRRWQRTVREDEPIRAMMEWYPAARYNVGELHKRYRSASVASIDGVDLFSVPSMVENVSIPLINKFCKVGSADLMADYTFPLVLEVINRIVGCPADLGRQIAIGMAARFDQTSTVTAQQGMKMIKDALLALITLKREIPAADACTRLVQHSNGLDDVEVFAQLMSFYGAGFELQRNMITNTLLLMLTDPRYAGTGYTLSTITALDEVLFNDPPMANFCTTYPQQPIMVDEILLPADQPVLISLAACNNDPEIRDRNNDFGSSHVGNRSHLGWSTGPHTCPAKPLAYEIGRCAIDELLNALPDMRPAVPAAELIWRPGPFHRALVGLPVRFDQAPPMVVPAQP